MKLNRAKTAMHLRLQHPDRVLTKVPKAKKMSKHEVIVPFNLDVARELALMEITVPSPISHQYTWPGRFKPFKAQATTSAFATLHERCFILNDLGTGKTMSVLWAFDYLRSIKRATRILISAPLSTLDRAWADEVFMHFPHLTFHVCHGTKRKRRNLLLEKADVYIINHDGMHIVEDILEKRPDIDLIIVDEVSLCARNAQTRRWKAHNRVINKQLGGTRCAWGLTGTPTPNLPTDAWAQVKLIRPKNVPFVFSKFRNRTMMQRGPFLWVPRGNANACVKEIMKPAIRFARDEVIDLPPVMYESRTCELSADQARAYKSMYNTMMVQAKEGRILAVNEAVKANKLVQIACGVAYNSKGAEVTLNPDKRLRLLKETIDETQFKVIVFVPFVSTVRLVLEYVRSEGYTAECIYGDVKKTDRDRIFQSFQQHDNPHILVAQPAAMSHGLTLTQANMIIWYAPVTSNDIYTQANGRITRPGQLNKQFIIHIEGTEIERKIFSRLKSKQNMQGILLDSVQQSRPN
jgi:SNF2 family DNA or RNA helicase